MGKVMGLLTDIRLAIAWFRLLRRFRRTGKGGTLSLSLDDAES